MKGLSHGLSDTNFHNPMIHKLFTPPKERKTRSSALTAMDTTLANPPKKVPDRSSPKVVKSKIAEPPKDLFWDGYSDIGYC